MGTFQPKKYYFLITSLQHKFASYPLRKSHSHTGRSCICVCIPRGLLSYVLCLMPNKIMLCYVMLQTLNSGKYFSGWFIGLHQDSWNVCILLKCCNLIFGSFGKVHLDSHCCTISVKVKYMYTHKGYKRLGNFEQNLDLPCSGSIV